MIPSSPYLTPKLNCKRSESNPNQIVCEVQEEVELQIHQMLAIEGGVYQVVSKDPMVENVYYLDFKGQVMPEFLSRKYSSYIPTPRGNIKKQHTVRKSLENYKNNITRLNDQVRADLIINSHTHMNTNERITKNVDDRIKIIVQSPVHLDHTSRNAVMIIQRALHPLGSLTHQEGNVFLLGSIPVEVTLELQ